MLIVILLKMTHSKRILILPASLGKWGEFEPKVPFQSGGKQKERGPTLPIYGKIHRKRGAKRAENLGAGESEIDAIARYLGITLFWQKGSGSCTVGGKVLVGVTEGTDKTMD